MTRRQENGLTASFEHLDDLLRAIVALRAEGRGDLQVFSPVPRHEISHALEGHPPLQSPVRRFTFLGATFGLCFGFALAIGTSLVWNLIVGGKPVVSIPPFLVVAFELTILFGAIATLLAVFHFGRLPGRLSPGYHPRFSDDRFGIYLRAKIVDFAALEALLRAQGAEAVWKVQDGRREQPEEGAA